MKKKILSIVLCITVIAVFSLTSVTAFGASDEAKASIGKISVVNNSFTVSWNKVNNAVKYQVAYKEDGKKTWKKETTEKLKLKIRGSSLTGYTVKLRAKVGSDYGAWSETKKVKTNFARPEIAAMSYNGKLIADWGKVKNAKKYEVKYKLASKDSWSKEYLTSRNFSIKAKAGYTYKIKVRAISGKTKGAWSNTKTIITKKGYPGSRSKHVTLGWKGRYSSDMWYKTIEMYKAHYKPLSVNSKKASKSISLDVGKYDSCKIISVSVLRDDMDEKGSLIEEYVEQSYNSSTGILTFDGSVGYDSISKGLVSYTVKMKNDEGTTYKYFRVKYHKPKAAAVGSDDEGGETVSEKNHLWADGKAIVKKPELKGKELTAKINGISYKGTYHNSMYLYKNSYRSDFYRSSEGEFSVNEKTGEVDSLALDDYRTGTLSENDLKDKALDFASRYINVKKYDLKVNEKGDLIIFDFNRNIYDTQTSAMFTVAYSTKGDFVQFFSRSVEDIDSLINDYTGDALKEEVAFLKSDDVRSLVKEKAEKIYPGCTKVKIVKKILVVLDNGKPGMLYSTEVTKKNNTLTALDIVVSDSL